MNKNSSCPFCNFELQMMNGGNGIYHKCPNCHALVYNFAMLKREGFNRKIFSGFLIKAKQNKTNFQGQCGNCEQPYREVQYEINNYKSKIYICPTCLNFAFSAIEIPILKRTNQKTDKIISPSTKMAINQLDKKFESENKNGKSLMNLLKSQNLDQ